MQTLVPNSWPESHLCLYSRTLFGHPGMTGFFLKIHDFLAGRKALAGLLASALVLSCGLLASRMHYEEDISRFLPSDEESALYSEAYGAMGEKNNIAVVFSAKEGSGASTDDIVDAIHFFGEAFDQADPEGLVSGRQVTVDQDAVLDMMDAVSSSFPLYMTEADYSRIDSLLAVPGYVASELQSDRQALMFPSGDLVVDYLRSDPLHLFSPVLGRLRSGAGGGSHEVVGDCLFTRDGKGLAFLTSPYGASESGMNSKVALAVEQACRKVGAEFPGVEVSAVGSPLIAAGNADRIKKDSLLAVSVALVLIALLLFLAYKRFSDIAWIGVSVLFGWITAIGLMSLFRDSMSIIVLGVASVIIGIAVNYPLHYVDGFKAGVSPRMNLKEMVHPLLTGNVTTIAAFLCLVGLDAVAMKDLGLFGSLMLAGTIVFVLVFLPVFARPRKAASRTVELGSLLPDKVPGSPWLFIAVALATVLMYSFSRRTSFDPDMRNINYMTASQKEGLEVLEGGLVPDGTSQMFAIAEGGTIEQALERNDSLQDRLAALGGRLSAVRGAGGFLPSASRQAEKARRWEDFWSTRREALVREFLPESSRAGFSDDAFKPFLDLLMERPQVHPIDGDSPALKAFDGTFFLQGEGSFKVVSRVCYKDAASGGIGRDDLKAALRSEGTMVFDTADISNQLVKVLSESFDRIALVCSLVVFLFLCLSFRRLELSLISFLPLAVSWFWILGIMGLLDIRFNIVNIILATFIFGQGDDYTIFITEGLIYEYAYGKKRLSTYKNSIFLSALIMFIGIGALVLARHPAMKSLGTVTVIGMFIVVMMAYYLPPVIFRALTEKHGVKRDVPITLKRLLLSGFALTAFVLLMFLFVYPWTFFHFLGRDTEEKRLSYHRFLQKLAGWLCRHVPGVRTVIPDLGKISFEKPAVIICNHQSHLDQIFLMQLTPKLVFFTNDWVWNNPLYGYVIRKAEYYPVADGLEKNLGRIKDLASRGYSVVVFPEGTRTRDGRIGRFHRGAFYVSSELGLDILPVFLHGADHVLPKTDFMLREGTVTMEVGGRIAPGGDYRLMTRQVHRMYLERFDQMCRRLQTASYLSKYVMYKYLYKGAGVESRARKALSAVGGADFPGTVGAGPSHFEMHGCGQGEYSLLYALMHPETEVDAYCDDEDDFMLASSCSNLPPNLHYHLEK